MENYFIGGISLEKIIVEIKCPTLSESFEFRISKKLSVNEGIEKIISEIRSYAGNELVLSGDVNILSKKTGLVLNKKMSFTENGVISGDILMII